MNPRESFTVAHIDRRRECDTSREARNARSRMIRAVAKAGVEIATRQVQDRDHPAMLAAIVEAASARLAAIAGPVEAATALTKGAGELFGGKR